VTSGRHAGDPYEWVIQERLDLADVTVTLEIAANDGLAATARTMGWALVGALTGGADAEPAFKRSRIVRTFKDGRQREVRDYGGEYEAALSAWGQLVSGTDL
jgi:hypothetical protein